MRRVATTLALAAAAALLCGCVYDPYTGALAPCCAYYGYPYGYRYPAPYPPYGYPPGPYSGSPPASYGAPRAGSYSAPPADPNGAPPEAQPGAYQGPTGGAAFSTQGGSPGQGGSLAQGGSLTLRFAAANVTNDGRLTREQAEAAMPLVAQNFDAIDADGKGYVTLSEIQGFMAQRRAAGGQPIRLDAN
jgi:hypothetical protein